MALVKLKNLKKKQVHIVKMKYSLGELSFILSICSQYESQLNFLLLLLS